MQDLSNLTFTKIPLDQQVKEAVTYTDPIKVETLLALGVKHGEIRKLARGAFLKTGEQSTQATSNIDKAKHWTDLQKKKKLPELVLRKIFKLDSAKAEESMKFYLASGGSFDSITTFLKSASMPRDLAKKVEFLDIIRRTISLEEQYLEEHPPLKKAEKQGFFAKLFSSKETDSPNNPEEISKAATLFSHFITQDETAKLFHQACAEGYKDLVIRMVNLDVDINTPYPGTGATPLHTAAWKGNNELVSWLVEHGANIDATTNITEEAGKKTKKGQETPLHMACSKGNRDVVVNLVNLGAQFEVPSAVGHTALHYACNNNEEIALFLIGEGANVNARNDKGVTPLHYACLKGLTNLVRHMLQKGADPSIIDKFNEAPLQAVIAQGPGKLISELFATNPKVLELMKRNQLKDLLTYFKQHPEELLVSAEEIPASNPLEVPFLFNDTELASLLKFLMNPRNFKLAIAALQEKYPKLSLKVLIDANLHVDTPIVHKLSAKEDIPPVPRIDFDKLKLLFGSIEFLSSPEFDNIPQNEVSFDQDGNVQQRKLIDVPSDGESHETEVVITKAIEFGNLSKINAEHLILDESGSIGNPFGHQFPYVIMKIGDVMMPVKVFQEDGKNVIELRVELLKALFNTINFTDATELTVSIRTSESTIKRKFFIHEPLTMKELDHPEPLTMKELDHPAITKCIEGALSDLNCKTEQIENIQVRTPPGYRDPDTIVDSGSTKDSAPTKVSPKQLQAGLKALCDAINFRIPFVGTPKSDEPEKLEDWYQYLEDIVKHVINATIDEDFEARGKVSPPDEKTEKSAPSAADKDPTPSAPSVIELGISGLHCGTRSLDDAQFLYDTKFSKPQTVEDRVLGFIEKFKTGIGEKMVDLTNAHNVHVKNKILQVIDEKSGIPHAEKKKRFYFNDPIAPKLIDSEKIMRIFNREFNPTAIIDIVDNALNEPPKEIDGELIIDWFKDNIPDDWEREKYEKIKAGLKGKGTKEEKSSYLQEFDIYPNPMDLKKAKEPNWEKIIEDDRKTCYLEEEVMDMMTGKIKRTAIIHMLTTFNVFKS